MAFKDEEQAKAYWAENISLLFKLLAVWFVVSFGFGILLVDVLNEVRFLGLNLASGSPSKARFTPLLL